jgi:hypothetical protein
MTASNIHTSTIITTTTKIIKKRNALKSITSHNQRAKSFKKNKQKKINLSLKQNLMS